MLGMATLGKAGKAMVARPGPWGEAREGTAGMEVPAWIGTVRRVAARRGMAGIARLGVAGERGGVFGMAGTARVAMPGMARQGKVIGGTAGQSRIGGGVFGIARGGNVRRGDAGLAVWLKRVSALAS